MCASLPGYVYVVMLNGLDAGPQGSRRCNSSTAEWSAAGGSQLKCIDKLPTIDRRVLPAACLPACHARSKTRVGDASWPVLAQLPLLTWLDLSGSHMAFTTRPEGKQAQVHPDLEAALASTGSGCSSSSRCLSTASGVNAAPCSLLPRCVAAYECPSLPHLLLVRRPTRAGSAHPPAPAPQPG